MTLCGALPYSRPELRYSPSTPQLRGTGWSGAVRATFATAQLKRRGFEGRVGFEMQLFLAKLAVLLGCGLAGPAPLLRRAERSPQMSWSSLDVTLRGATLVANASVEARRGELLGVLPALGPWSQTLRLKTGTVCCSDTVCSLRDLLGVMQQVSSRFLSPSPPPGLHASRDWRAPPAWLRTRSWAPPARARRRSSARSPGAARGSAASASSRQGQGRGQQGVVAQSPAVPKPAGGVSILSSVLRNILTTEVAPREVDEASSIEPNSVARREVDEASS